jgi:hypothetical protein
MATEDEHYLQQYLKGKVKNQAILINDLRSDLQKERFKSLKLRLDLQVILENPGSLAAQKIRHRWNIQRVIFSEAIAS